MGESAKDERELRSDFSSLSLKGEGEIVNERSAIRSRSTEATGGKGEEITGRLRGIGEGGKEIEE